MALLILVNEAGRKEYSLGKTDTTVGRGSTCTIRITDDAEASRIHCCIQQRGNDYVVIDETSRNGTYVNGTRVMTEEVVLKDGDDIRIGKTFLVFRTAADQHREKTNVLFQEVLDQLADGKDYRKLLKDIVKSRPQ